MPKWTGITLDDVAPVDRYPVDREVGGTVSAQRLSPDGYSLWMVHASLGEGATIGWSGERSDDVVYVIGGEIEVNGHRCETGSAVVVERDAEARLVARGDSEIVHFGSVEAAPPTDGPLGPPASGATAIHAYGPDGAFVSGERENVHAVWFADGTCDTCRVQLLEVASPPSADGRGKPHSHTADEIIYLLDGSVRMGSYSFGPGSALSIPGDVRYSLVSGPEGHRFINFRRDVSLQMYGRGGEPLLETAIARGGRVTGDVR